MKCTLEPSLTMMSVCSNWPAPGAFSRKYDCSGIFTCTCGGTYTNEPPDQTAPCRATNLWSSGGTSFMKCFLTIGP